jgi:hypothetical protein
MNRSLRSLPVWKYPLGGCEAISAKRTRQCRICVVVVLVEIRAEELHDVISVGVANGEHRAHARRRRFANG